MSEKSVRPPIEPQSNRRKMADRINRAFATSDITAICHAIGDATRLHNISELARDAEIERSSIYRSFAGKELPNFSTVLRVLGANGWDSSLGSHNAVEIVQSKPENETQNLKVERGVQPSIASSDDAQDRR
jgi:probable addiction module antidote protein